MAVDEILYSLEQGFYYLQEKIIYAAQYVYMIPFALRLLFVIILCVAVLNIVASLVKAVIGNLNSWKKIPDEDLMYSFAAGSGQYQRKYIYGDAHKYLFDKKWSWVSFAGLAYRLGNLQNQSRTILFFCSILYLPLAILGAAEMIIRCLAGVIIFFAVNLVYMLCLLLLWIVNLILMPLFHILDKSSLAVQHCPRCYGEYRLAVFACPHCGTNHTKLRPGTCGLLFAKCSCGHFIPCASATKRNNLKAYCPKCGDALAGSNIKALTVQIIGGNSSGKTAYIAAFQHQYIEAVNQAGIQVTVSPESDFRELERTFLTGKTVKSPSDEVRAYHILHNGKSNANEGVVIYDVPDEILLSEQYDRNPLNFAYSDGIIIILDPTSVHAVRKECETISGTASTVGFSDDSADDIIVHFINKYSEVAGRSARKMSSVPVAVVIAKTDLTAIRRQIGPVKIKKEYYANRNTYASLQDARDAMCRKYLSDIGLSNVVNNLDSVFSRVSFFPVSAIGHREDGQPFDPQDVISPIGWLAKRFQSSIKDLVVFVEENV